MYKTIRQTIDVRSGGGELCWPDSLAVQGEDKGHRWEVHVLDDGKPASLKGATAECYVVNGGVTTRISAAIAGSDVSAVFPSGCYAQSGELRAILRVYTPDGAAPAMALLRLRVQEGVTEVISDPEHVVPSLHELLAQIDACRTSAQQANTAAKAANTAATNANNKASAANTAAAAVNTAIAKINGMTVSAAALAAGAAPTAAVSETGGHKHIAFGIPRGNTGATPRLTIGTVTTGSPADKAAATLTGTPEKPVLSLTIPQGKPGTGFGTVTSVNSVKPDAAGNVALNLPRNLLDNSDFSAPVAQAGLNGAHGKETYAVDRWVSGLVTVWQYGAYLKAAVTDSSARITQRLPAKLVAGKRITIAAKLSSVNQVYVGVYYEADGTTKSVIVQATGVNGILAASGLIPSNAENITARVYPSYNNEAGFSNICWVALYEGEYTARTLPPYVPKGYAAELAECQRYFQIRSANNVPATDMRPLMRLSSPTVTATAGGYAYCADL